MLFRYFFTSYPLRLSRFILFYTRKDSWTRPFSLIEWISLLLDLVGIPEILQVFHEIVNWSTRSLSPKEKWNIDLVFKDSLNLDRIRINANDFLISKNLRIAFVTFHTIHYFGSISQSLLIHEIVHVWQYEKFGSAYIIRALLAQRSVEGYDYGGLKGLTKEHLLDYNFEQMAEIIRHAYDLRMKNRIYNNFVKQLQEY